MSNFALTLTLLVAIIAGLSISIGYDHGRFACEAREVSQ